MANSLRILAAALATAGLLAACGGGDGSDTTPRASITSVKVVGDSLSDSGTFGFKFTVQASASTGAASFQVWTERVAGLYGQTLCAHYSAADLPSIANPAINASCTNYAVGGAVINSANAALLQTPMSIRKQLQDAAAAGFSATDLLVVDGGSNDMSDLITASLDTTNPLALPGLAATLLDSATLAALQTQAGTDTLKFGALVGAAYMQALAKQFAASITENALAKGATHVAVLNIPALTLTPRIKAVQAGVKLQVAAAATAAGADAASAAAQGEAMAAQLAVLIDTWVQAYNSQLASSFAGDARVAIIDFYTELKNQVSDPVQYGYTNVTDPACPASGTDPTTHLPVYSLPLCTTAALLGKDATANWWDGYSFSDDLHPTPYGHTQMSQLASRALARAGWL
ncbi:SGNH/GDSL hydrolase family protein [Comamonas composti]|uniref:SGNH/GDSL hydrolase family protein n=1 Tax=Comamonas composti TaxID=408558 RepID=UPI0004246AD8|nr:SGNH/GDSL hydrolase family protein [Comamonas composti]